MTKKVTQIKSTKKPYTTLEVHHFLSYFEIIYSLSKGLGKTSNRMEFLVTLMSRPNVSLVITGKTESLVEKDMPVYRELLNSLKWISRAAYPVNIRTKETVMKWLLVTSAFHDLARPSLLDQHRDGDWVLLYPHVFIGDFEETEYVMSMFSEMLNEQGEDELAELFRDGEVFVSHKEIRILIKAAVKFLERE